MTWSTIGQLDISGSAGMNWQAFPLHGSTESLAKLFFLPQLSNWNLIYSRVLLKRVWKISGQTPVEEKAHVLYPTPNAILMNFPQPPVNSDYVNFEVQVKRITRYRTFSEPAYSVQVFLDGN